MPAWSSPVVPRVRQRHRQVELDAARACAHHDNAAAHENGLVDVVGDEEHRFALALPDAQQQFLHQLDHAQGLPVLRAPSLCTCCRHYPGTVTGGTALLIRPVISAPPERALGSDCASAFSRLARRSLALGPAHSSRRQFVARLPEGRVEHWRADIRRRWLTQGFRTGPQSGCHRHVSSPRLVERSRRFSALRSPACFASRVMGPIMLGRLSVCDCGRGSR